VTVWKIRKQIVEHIDNTRLRESFDWNLPAPILERLAGFGVECRQEKRR
jgi:hypothetical protein